MSEYKTYRWNRNASTHKDALTRFAFISFLFSGMVGLLISIMLLPYDRTHETYIISAIAMVLIILAVWTAIMLMLSLLYKELNELQYKPGSTPHTLSPPEKTRPIHYYQNGKLVHIEAGEGE